MVQLKVLGPIEAWVDGRAIDLGGPTQRRLIASLAAHAPDPLSTIRLIEYLWGSDPPPSAPASLQSYVSRLRRSLGSDAIETVPGGYRLADKVSVDASEFTRSALELSVDEKTRSSEIQQLLGMWRGPALEGIEHLDFASESLNESRLGLEEDLAHLRSQTGEHSEAIAILKRLTREQPLRESSWTGLAVVLKNASRQAEAIRALDEYRETLAEMGLEPGPDFEKVADDVFAPVAASASRRELQTWTTSFIGRSQDLELLKEALSSSRLVTVVGPGGMGKTRLATELARQYGEQVVEIRLDTVSESDNVAAAALSQLGAEARGLPLNALASQLKGTSLVLFDNAEHVLDSTAESISGLLEMTRTRILVTSREPLNMPGETVFPLDSVPLEAAVAIYRDRADSVDPSFDEPDDDIGALTAAVDNMPLGIEIAAARSRSMTPKEILERLGSRYEVLDRPLRGQVDRHRSLEALVTWSYDLLNHAEQRVFERLSIIAGPFGHNLAAEVAGFGVVEVAEVPDLIAALVEKSLLKRMRPGRYQMLRTLRALARTKLEDPDARTARQRHAEWFAGLAERIGEGLGTPNESEWITYANYAVDDMTAAVAFSAEQENLDTARRILEGLFDWYFHRQPPSIESWGALLLPRAEGHEVWPVAHAWEALAQLKAGNSDRAASVAAEGTRSESPSARFAWFMAAEIACYQDRLDDALDSYRRQLVRASETGDHIGVIDAVAGETIALAFQGHFGRAVDVGSELEQLTSEIGAPTYLAYADYARGEALVESDTALSARLLGYAAERAAEVKNTYIEGMARTTLGAVLTELGNYEEALSNLNRGLELWQSTGLQRYEWTIVQHLASLLDFIGDTAGAASLVAAAEKVGRRPFGAGRRRWTELVSRYGGHDPATDVGTPDEILSLEEATAVGFQSATRIIT